MPLRRCTVNKKGGWRWGNSGKCYTGPGGKKQAIKQGIAVEGPEKFAAKAHSLDLDFSDLETIVEELSHSGLGLGDQAVIITTIAAKMTRKQINNLPDSDFAYIESGGKKDKEGKTVPRSLRHFPIHDVAHVRNALARLPQSKLSSEAKAKALRKIRTAAKKFGVQVSNS